MADTNETIADIIAWLRRPREGENAYLTLWRDEIADRLEAAHKRERGDAAKLREALEAIISGYENADLCDTNYGEWCHEPENPCVNVSLCKAIHESRVALAAPPRNCDVGTAQEQLERLNAYCKKCDGCMSYTRPELLDEVCLCALKWAQMPYEEGGAK